MDISGEQVIDAITAQRNDALDKLVYMTALAKALEGKVAELEKQVAGNAAEITPAAPAELPADMTK